jgi:hypothetical protein
MKQKLYNIAYQIVYGVVFFIPLFFVCLLPLGVQMSTPFFIAYLIVAIAILIFRKQIFMLKPLWALYMRTTYVNDPTNIKRNLRPGRIISVVLVLIAVVAMQYEYRSFRGDTIDEVIAKKYQCEASYIESNDYYYVTNTSNKNVKKLPDVVHLKADGKYVFFSSGIFGYPKEAQQLDCTDMQVDFATIYKLTKDNAYIIFVQDSDPEGYVAIYDNDGEISHLADSFGNIVWFKVVTELDDSYKVYSKKGDAESFIVDSAEIMRRFSK